MFRPSDPDHMLNKTPNDKSQTIEHNNLKGGGAALLHHLDYSRQYLSLTPNHPKYGSGLFYLA